jgi:hypothetical protein
VNGTAGTVEKLTVDMAEGFIGPGFSSESNLSEIEFAVTWATPPTASPS